MRLNEKFVSAADISNGLQAFEECTASLTGGYMAREVECVSAQGDEVLPFFHIMRLMLQPII